MEKSARQAMENAVCRIAKSDKTTAGLTLLELVLAIVIVGAAMVPLANLLAVTLRPIYRDETITQAIRTGRGLMDEVLSKWFDENRVNNASPIGPDAGEVGRSQYDDVDDYHGFSENLPGGFTRSVSVRYLKANQNVFDPVYELTQTGTPGVDFYKEIVVTVTGHGIQIGLTGMATTANSQGI